VTATNSAVLITGANTGLGKDVARQLAILGTFGTIYLACRNEAKAEIAKRDLERITGRCSTSSWWTPPISPR